MPNNFATTVQNFVGKLLKLTELLLVEFLVLKFTISNIVSETLKLDDYDYRPMLVGFACDFTH